MDSTKKHEAERLADYLDASVAPQHPETFGIANAARHLRRIPALDAETASAHSDLAKIRDAFAKQFPGVADDLLMCTIGGPSEVLPYVTAVLAELEAQRVALSNKEVQSLVYELGYAEANHISKADFINGIRAGELKHGIGIGTKEGGEG